MGSSRRPPSVIACRPLAASKAPSGAGTAPLAGSPDFRLDVWNGNKAEVDMARQPRSGRRWAKQPAG